MILSMSVILLTKFHSYMNINGLVLIEVAMRAVYTVCLGQRGLQGHLCVCSSGVDVNKAVSSSGLKWTPNLPCCPALMAM